MNENHTNNPQNISQDDGTYGLSADPDLIAEEHHKNTNYLKSSLKLNVKVKPDHDKYCRKCAYNLRSLRSGPCPECGRHFDAGNPATYCKSKHVIIQQHSCDIKAVAYPLLILGLPLLAFFIAFILHNKIFLALLSYQTPFPEFINLLDTIAFLFTILFLIASPIWAFLSFFITARFTTPYQKLSTNFLIFIGIAVTLCIPFMLYRSITFFALFFYITIAVILTLIQEWRPQIRD